MPGPPPPPPAALHGRDALLAELSGLDTPDLLALCLRFRRAPERLGLYLSVLRSRFGERAQFAACLVCFDMARQGVASAQAEFEALAPTVRKLAERAELTADLLRDDPYLTPIWLECKEALATGDAGTTLTPLDTDVEMVGEIDLLSDEELEGVEFEFAGTGPDLAAAEAEYGRYVIAHLGHDPERGSIQVGRGFSTDSADEIDRLETFVQGLAQRGTLVPRARGLAALGHLYLGTHLRQRNLFGRPNPRRVAALRAGLLELPEDLDPLARAGEVFAFEGQGVVRGFQKVTELLVDYLRFCLRERKAPRDPRTVEAYLALDRKPPTLERVASGR